MSQQQELQTYEWRGQTRFRCPEHPECQFDSHSVEILTKHWVDSHRPAGIATIGPTLYDPEERLVDKEPTIELPAALRNRK